jgi:hypothetical protein
MLKAVLTLRRVSSSGTRLSPVTVMKLVSPNSEWEDVHVDVAGDSGSGGAALFVPGLML